MKSLIVAAVFGCLAVNSFGADPQIEFVSSSRYSRAKHSVFNSSMNPPAKFGDKREPAQGNFSGTGWKTAKAVQQTRTNGKVRAEGETIAKTFSGTAGNIAAEYDHYGWAKTFQQGNTGQVAAACLTHNVSNYKVTHEGVNGKKYKIKYEIRFFSRTPPEYVGEAALPNQDPDPLFLSTIVGAEFLNCWWDRSEGAWMVVGHVRDSMNAQVEIDEVIEKPTLQHLDTNSDISGKIITWVHDLSEHQSYQLVAGTSLASETTMMTKPLLYESGPNVNAEGPKTVYGWVRITPLQVVQTN